MLLKIMILFILGIIINKSGALKKTIKRKRIGVIGLESTQNVGNMLVKFAMYTKLKEYGLIPIMISTSKKGDNIDFIKKHVKLKEIHSFVELKKTNYDILMVNSDQTWANWDKKNFLDYGFLRFAKSWAIPKFVYGASFAKDYWPYSKTFDKTAKNLLKNFTGISLRERGSIKLVEKHLGIKSSFVLDPTFLINKKYYIKLIKGFKTNFNKKKYICVYQLDKNDITKKYIQKARKILKYKIYMVSQYQNNYVENFLFGIYNSKAVITDSFHGTVFSIIFNKPFIAFINSFRGRERFYSLNQTFNLKRRIVYPFKNETINISLLKTPLNINKTTYNKLKNFSLKYLKKHLGIL
jgi:hypothetical protein